MYRNANDMNDSKASRFSSSMFRSMNMETLTARERRNQRITNAEKDGAMAQDESYLNQGSGSFQCFRPPS